MRLEVLDYAFYDWDGAFLIATSRRRGDGSLAYQINQTQPIINGAIFYRTLEFGSEGEVIGEFDRLVNADGWKGSNSNEWPFEFSREELDLAIARFDGNP